MKLKTFGDGYSPGTGLYVGIDQSYSGFAITILGEDSSFKTTVAKFDIGGASRLSNIQNHLKDTLNEAAKVGTIKDTAMEGYAFGSQMANKLGELGGVVKLTLYGMDNLSEGKYPLIVPPMSLKKYITGKANINKNQILLNVFKKWKVDLMDDNGADSYGLAHLVSGKHTLGYEKEIYDKIFNAEHREK
jgi:Holliday junction resolvasome RuvABC endonuclease subunit